MRIVKRKPNPMLGLLLFVLIMFVLVVVSVGIDIAVV